MAIKKIKVVIWCGAAANQKALANKIAAEFEVNGSLLILIPAERRKKNWLRFLQSLNFTGLVKLS